MYFRHYDDAKPILRTCCRYTLKKYKAEPNGAVTKKIMNHSTLLPTEDLSSRTQCIVIPNKRSKQDGAARTPRGAANMRRPKSALGIFSSCENHGVSIKAMKIPIATMIQAAYWKSLNAFSEQSQRDILVTPASQKYFPAILSHSGQSCFELSPHTSSQFGIALPFKIAEKLMFWSRHMSQSAEPSTIFICR
jgi:hypothetical protein